MGTPAGAASIPGLGGLVGLIERAAGEAVGFGVGTALGRTLEPEAVTLAQTAWGIDPALVLDPQTLALLVRLGRRQVGEVQGDANAGGLSNDRFNHLIEALKTPPGTAELIELQRRGKLPAPDLQTWLERAGTDERLSAQLADLQHLRLASADVANGVQQGFLANPGLIVGAPPSQGLLGIDPVTEAAATGVDEERLKLLCELVGLPPGIGEGLELLRRGEIDEARFARYVAEGHTKTKYTQDLLKLRRTVLSPAVYAEALLRERITLKEAQDGAALSGLNAADLATWTNMMGRPPGIGEALTLVNRGIPGTPGGNASRAYFREVVARSDVRTEYADDLYNLRVHYPPLFQVGRALQNGTIDPALASETLLAEGYPQAWVDAIVKAGSKVKTAAHKPLALSVVETSYDAGLIDHAAAVTAIEALGYDQAETDELLQLHEARRIVAELGHAVTIVRSRYTGWKIDAPTAQAELQSLQIAQAQIDRLLGWWATERDANRPQLTTAQIVAGFFYSRYTYPQALAELQSRGWSADDALTLLWDRTHGDPRPAGTA